MDVFCCGVCMGRTGTGTGTGTEVRGKAWREEPIGFVGVRGGGVAGVADRCMGCSGGCRSWGWLEERWCWI